MSEILPWNERVPMISVNPHAATIDDIGCLASDLMKAKSVIKLLEQKLRIAEDCLKVYVNRDNWTHLVTPYKENVFTMDVKLNGWEPAADALKRMGEI